jgi:amino acid adenylation domain-containing protein
MNIHTLLTRIRRAGIHLSVRGDRLLCTAPPDALTPELQCAIRERRDAIVKFLKVVATSSCKERVELHSVKIGDDLSLSSGQRRLWFLDRLVADSCTYNMGGAWWLRGILVPEALKRAFNQLVRRHEVLRTAFPDEQGYPRVVISDASDISLPIIDLSERALDEGQSNIVGMVANELRRPFDLTTPPLFRVKLIVFRRDLHILVFAIHHIVFDHASYDIFFKELNLAYQAALRGNEAILPARASRYVDYAHTEKIYANNDSRLHALSFWKDYLQGELPVVDLPAYRTRPKFQTYVGAQHRWLLPRSIVDGLDNVGHDLGLTLFLKLLAVFFVFIHRHTNQSDIIVGTPVSIRDQWPEFDQTIGFFVNTLPIRLDLSEAPTFEQLLDRLRMSFLDALSNRNLPFAMLIEELHQERAANRLAIVQVAFAFLSNSDPAPLLLGIETETLECPSTTAKFDLTLFARDRCDGLELTFEYNTDIFDESTIKKFQCRIDSLIAGIVHEPKTRIDELPLLSDDDFRQLLVNWNDTSANFAKTFCIHELFEQQAAQTPDRIAVVSGESTLTFGELNRRANQLAHRLRRLGSGPEVLVGLCAERSVELVIGVLGILKSGGAYLPLALTDSASRRRSLLADANVTLIVTSGELTEATLPAKQCVDLERDQEILRQEPLTDPIGYVCPRNLAYVIYTSGSTGVPKGVAIEHLSAVAMLSWAMQSLKPEDIVGVLASTAISFDLSIYELFLPLASGGTIVMVDSVLQLPTMPNRDTVSLINTVPSLMAELLQRSGSLSSSVRRINLAGESLAQGLVDQLHALPARHELWDLYGPSESTTYSTAGLRMPHKAATIGRPISNTQVYLLDRSHGLVPPFVAGEIHLGGTGLARGYLGRPGFTAERFMPDCCSGGTGARLYRTGDFARFRADGQLEFLGRRDSQVKIRGVRIELREIEYVLTQHAQIRQVAVITRKNERDELYITAYVAGHPNIGPTSDQMRDYLKGRLPAAMIPQHFVMLPSLPFTSRGKLDLAALPPPDLFLMNGADHAPATTATEKRVAQIWSEILGVPNVGRDDCFFDLGGHSLLATRVLWCVRDIFGVDLPLRSIFDRPTVAELSCSIDEAQCKSDVIFG